eukprot:7953316-Ditylum_brightwellii.AAC.1
MTINKPKRPLSAYNFFFKHERENIIMAAAVAEGFDPLEVLKELRITASATGKRRRCRLSKFKVKIGFSGLAKNVAGKWNSLNAADKAPFEAMAMEEKKLYEANVKEWKKKMAEKHQHEHD